MAISFDVHHEIYLEDELKPDVFKIEVKSEPTGCNEPLKIGHIFIQVFTNRLLNGLEDRQMLSLFRAVSFECFDCLNELFKRVDYSPLKLRTTGLAYIEYVSVDSEHQDVGYGGRLVSAAIEHLESLYPGLVFSLLAQPYEISSTDGLCSVLRLQKLWLKGWYRKFGFSQPQSLVSSDYMYRGI